MDVNYNGLPVFGTLAEFSSLTGVNNSYLKSVIHRKIVPYHNFFIPKQSGGVRVISSPEINLRKVQNFIKDKILDTDFISKKIYKHVYSYRKSYSIIDNARCHIDARWMVKVDIKDFFKSIKEYMIYKFFLSLGYSSFLSFSMARLVTCPSLYYNINKFNKNTMGSLPQGAPTSPQISNLIFYDVDKDLNILSKKYECIYTRYADDIIFSTYNDITIHQIHCLIKSVKNILNRNNYQINKNKTKIIYPNAKKIVTGIVINEKRLLLSKNIKDEIKKNVFFAEKNGLESQKNFINFDGDLDCFVNYLLGKINFANQVEPKFANIWRNRLMDLVNKTK